MATKGKEQSIMDLIKLSEDRTKEAEIKLAALNQRLDSVKPAQTEADFEKLKTQSAVLESLQEAKENMQNAQQREQVREQQLETITQENATLKTTVLKLEYRITHLMRYITQLEESKEKVEYRVNHLLGHISELEKKLENGGTSNVQPEKIVAPNKVKNTNANTNTKTNKESSGKKAKPESAPDTHNQQKPTEKKPEVVTIKNSSQHPQISSDDNTRTILFFWPYSGNTVRVAGTFSRWDQLDIDRLILITPGRYQYKFNVDGNWYHDILKPTCDDGCGGFNNVIWIQ